MREQNFDFGPIPTLAGYEGAEYEGVIIFFANWPIFNKIDPSLQDSKIFFMLCNFFIRPPAEALQPWPGL